MLPKAQVFNDDDDEPTSFWEGINCCLEFIIIIIISEVLHPSYLKK